MRKTLLILLITVLSIFTCLGLVACDNGGVPAYSIEYVVEDTTYHSSKVENGTIIDVPENPTLEGYVFDAWYFDKDTWTKPLTMQSLLDMPLTQGNIFRVYAKFTKYTCEMDNQEHNYEMVEEVKATCTTSGYQEYKCSVCDKEYTQTLYPLQHQYKNEITTPAKCGVTGVRTYTCTREGCNYFYTQTISALQHTYKNEITTPAKCGVAGVRTYTCTREDCNHSYTQSITALKHTLDNTKHCTRDNCDYFENFNFIVKIHSPSGIENKNISVEYGKKYTIEKPNITIDGLIFNGYYDNNGNMLSNSSDNYEQSYNGTVINSDIYAYYTYNINDIDDLTALQTNQTLINYYSSVDSNKYLTINLVNNIDISLLEWTPIGSESEPFRANFNGNNKIINGLKITALQNSCNMYGFFGMTKGGKINNLSLTNININLPALSNSVCVGGIVGCNDGTALEQIITSGDIRVANHSSSYTSYVGGLVGYGSIYNIQSCVNNSNVSAKNIAGGIIGFSEFTVEGGIFTSNINNGDITSSDIAGGLIGKGTAPIVSKCKNNGDILATNNSGGIIGSAQGTAYIVESANTGNVSTTGTTSSQFDGAGGLIGTLVMDTNYFGIGVEINDSYNTGKITSTKNAGGIIGGGNIGTTVKINNCYNSGNIDGEFYAGGIAGALNPFNITQCINIGTVKADAISATIAHIIISSSVSDCYYNCTTSGVTSIQGEKTTEKYAESFYTEELFWNSKIWDFHTDKMPTLKMESIFNI